MSQDPFSGPSPIPVTFASVQSFQGRLVLIEPKKTEMAMNDDNGQMQERITATVTVIDGSGPVKTFKRRVDTGMTLEGPEFPGVWIGQQMLVGQLKDGKGNLLPMVLGRFDTKTRGGSAGKGNPWEIYPPTDQDVQVARKYLADRYAAQANAAVANAAPTQAPAQAPAQNGNPFGGTEAPF